MKNNKLKLLWILACNSSSVDQRTNSLSLFNIMEQINVGVDPKNKDSFPSKEGVFVPIPFEIVALVSKFTEDVDKDFVFSAKISSIDPNGKVLGENPFEVNIEKGKKRMRLNIKTNGLKVTIGGEYLFRLSIKAKGEKEYVELGEFPVEVVINK